MKVLNDWIHIKLDPDEEKVGTLYKPQGAYDHILRTAEVLQVGPGKWVGDTGKREPMGLEPGDGVVFIRFVADSTKTAQSIQAKIGENEALIRQSDVMLVYDRKEPPRFG